MEIRASFSLVRFARDLAQFAGNFQLSLYQADARLYETLQLNIMFCQVFAEIELFS